MQGKATEAQCCSWACCANRRAESTSTYTLIQQVGCFCKLGCYSFSPSPALQEWRHWSGFKPGTYEHWSVACWVKHSSLCPRSTRHPPALPESLMLGRMGFSAGTTTSCIWSNWDSYSLPRLLRKLIVPHSKYFRKRLTPLMQGYLIALKDNNFQIGSIKRFKPLILIDFRMKY